MKKMYLEIAKTDLEIGVTNAIEKAQEFGFNASTFYKSLDMAIKYSNCNDYDLMVLKSRDYAYKVWGIEKQMKKAYEMLSK